MKKCFISTLSALLAFFMVLSLTACSNADESSNDLSAYDIGHQFQAYPNCEFNYALTTDGADYVVHITSISAFLTEKHSIENNATIDSKFSPFVINLKASGSTDLPKQTKVAIHLKYNDNFTTTLSSSVGEDGSIYWEQSVNNILTVPKIYFSYISIIE